MKLPTHHTSRNMMFLSADVVGSTAFKSLDRSGSAGSGWMEAFESLFRELPLIYIGRLAQYFFDQDELPDSGVWKVMGDEIVFVASPTSLAQARRITAAFYDAVLSFDQRMAERWPLRIRGCCWAAEVGSRNRAIEIPEMWGGSEGRPYLDFLGPDIDTGFRLSAHSGSGELIVSPNLAEALAAAPDDQELDFHYLGEKVLKGVCGGHPFPLVMASVPGLGGRQRPVTAAGDLVTRLASLRDSMQRSVEVQPAEPLRFG